MLFGVLPKNNPLYKETKPMKRSVGLFLSSLCLSIAIISPALERKGQPNCFDPNNAATWGTRCYKAKE
jgi:hypothetical protein